MASLRAHSAPPAGLSFLLNKILSLITFLILLGAGWVAVSYLKSEITGSGEDGVTGRQMQVTPASSSAPTEQSQRDSAASKPLIKAPTLVYSAAGDNVYYHVSTHLPSKRERSALSEETARQRGLKPCPICIRKQ